MMTTAASRVLDFHLRIVHVNTFHAPSGSMQQHEEEIRSWQIIGSVLFGLDRRPNMYSKS